MEGWESWVLGPPTPQGPPHPLLSLPPGVVKGDVTLVEGQDIKLQKSFLQVRKTHMDSFLDSDT